MGIVGNHDDVTTWERYPHYWPFDGVIHQACNINAVHVVTSLWFKCDIPLLSFLGGTPSFGYGIADNVDLGIMREGDAWDWW